MRFISAFSILTLLALNARPVHALRFQQWYPRYTPLLTNLSQNVCNESLSLVMGIDYTQRNAPAQSTAGEYCYGHENCILQNLPAAYLANYQTASVILGLTPTFLASFSPSIAETSLLSAHRPLLSFLISLGVPAVYPTRIFDFFDPHEVLGAGKTRLRLPQFGRRGAVVLSLLEYILALAAAAIIIHTSMQLGANTILTWGCLSENVPLAWTFMSVPVHLTAAIGYKIALSKAKGDTVENYPPPVSKTSNDRTAKHRSRLQMLKRGALCFCSDEFRICASRSVLSVAPLPSPTGDLEWGVFLCIVAGIIGLIQVMIGIMVLSSLLFIAVSDFLNYVLWRYVFATVVCRVILIIELTGLRNIRPSK